MNKNVLVVEDDYFSSLIHDSALKALGFNMVGPIQTVKEGLRYTEQQDYICALLDINMDGELITPVAQRLREISCPVIFVTQYSNLDMLPESLRDLPFVQKPVCLSELQTAFKSIGFVPRSMENNLEEKIHWEDDFSVGIQSIDEQHRGIIKLINMLIDNPDQPVYSKITAEVLREMVNYVNNHLAYEESLLKQHDYPDFEEHRNHHLEYIKTVANFSMKALSTYNNHLSDEFLDYLKTWWTNHILVEDMKYKSFFEDKGIS